jgi:hypothetical protein
MSDGHFKILFAERLAISLQYSRYFPYISDESTFNCLQKGGMRGVAYISVPSAARVVLRLLGLAQVLAPV